MGLIGIVQILGSGIFREEVNVTSFNVGSEKMNSDELL